MNVYVCCIDRVLFVNDGLQPFFMVVPFVDENMPLSHSYNKGMLREH